MVPSLMFLFWPPPWDLTSHPSAPHLTSPEEYFLPFPCMVKKTTYYFSHENTLEPCYFCYYWWPRYLFPRSAITKLATVATTNVLTCFFSLIFCVSLSSSHNPQKQVLVSLIQDLDLDEYYAWLLMLFRSKQPAMGVTMFCKGCCKVTIIFCKGCRNGAIIPWRGGTITFLMFACWCLCMCFWLLWSHFKC